MNATSSGVQKVRMVVIAALIGLAAHGAISAEAASAFFQ